MAVLNKFDPGKTMYFRGFSGIDSPAAMHSVSGTPGDGFSFTVSGIFRDPAAFWVLVLFDIDDFYGHPRIKPLPDGDLTGVVLEFDVSFSGAAGYDNPKFPTIDWPFLDYILENGAVGSIDLSVGSIQYAARTPNAIVNPNPTTVASGTHTAASVTFTINVASPIAGDELLIWWENFLYSYVCAGGDTASTIAAALCTTMSGAIGINNYTYAGNLYGLSAVAIGASITITASFPGTAFATKTAQPGVDGNLNRLYWQSSNSARLSISAASPLHLQGGVSDCSYHVTLDFSALAAAGGVDLTSVRQLVLTFAPLLADSAAYIDPTIPNYGTQADVTFTNWRVTADPHGLMPLSVAGPGSVRVEETDILTTAVGTWHTTSVGWFSQGFAIYSNTVGDTITITYWCPLAHDLWLGTSVYSDRGKFGVTVDGAAQADLDMMLVEYGAGSTIGTPSTGTIIAEAISTRRQLAGAIAPGQHTVVLTVKTPDAPPSGISGHGYCYFDFLEACVASDVPPAPGPWTDRYPAFDFDTQHGYQLAPARLLWMCDALGFAGPANLYLGVFWWNQRNNPTQVFASLSLDFSTLPSLSLFTGGGAILLDIGGTTIGKTPVSGETYDIWAAHFCYYINETFSGVWASVAGSVLTITVRSAETTAYSYTFAASYQLYGGSPIVAWTTGQTGSLSSGSAAGTWQIDPAQTPVVNYAAEKWMADLFAGIASRGNVIAASMSMELVYPPDANTAGSVWAQRFADGTVVLTGTGFEDYFSTQCSPMAAAFLAYQKAAFLYVAALQGAAGLTPYLQCGEFLWWFFQNGGPFAGATGMAYFDAETKAATLLALGRVLYPFLTPNDDPSVNAYADALFLANRLAAHVAAIITYVQATYPAAVLEILWPGDVNGKTPTPISAVGGRLNNYVNFPVAWQSAASAPFTIFKLEALAFSTTDRNVDFMKATLAYIRALAWPVGQLRFLYSVDNPGVEQWSDYQLARGAGITQLTPFAIDQVCLIGWRLDPPETGEATVI